MDFNTEARVDARKVADAAAGGIAVDNVDLPLKGSSVKKPSGEAKPRKKRRRQWGSERPRPPLPIQEKPASTAATWLGGLAIAVTALAWAVYLVQSVVSRVIDNGINDSHFVLQTVMYVVIMTLLIFSAFMYLLARQGALYRSRNHVRVPRAEIDAFMADSRSSMTVLVPSYAEEPSVVRSTLLSAALQEYPGMNIVLLLDDPPVPSDLEGAASLDGCRALPGEIGELLSAPYLRFAASLREYEAAAKKSREASPDQVRALALDYVWGAAWLREQAAAYPRASHADDFLAEEVFGGLAGDFEITARALFRSLDERAPLPSARLSQLGRRLVWTFDATLSSFERKTYAHLPHDAN